ncbi:hypothetical protein HPB50_025541 [Hyalomma asiaticum]|uniref:Uncharacterized protein n=1 Tax=Hyalomma asiaticum TaxID=266040 RepID=A0ACB7RTM9_HYAAI|nr:hypothetical protein HPB50_025541 [Hyalomma asiaticum]
MILSWQPPRELRPIICVAPIPVNWWRTSVNRPMGFARSYTGRVARYRYSVQTPSAVPITVLYLSLLQPAFGYVIDVAPSTIELLRTVPNTSMAITGATP